MLHSNMKSAYVAATKYYAEGTLKIEGQFKQNPFSTWEDIKRKGVCNIRDGKWTYYTEEGAVLKEETYLNGKIINSSSGTLNLNSSSNQNTNTSTSSEKQGIRKIFSKKKIQYQQKKINLAQWKTATSGNICRTFSFNLPTY